MKHPIGEFKNILITAGCLGGAFLLSLLFQHVFDVREHITTLFVFAVYLVSRSTPGYVYGLSAAFIGTLAVNYAFTFPYFAVNFLIPVNLISAVIMIVIAVLTSALTTKLKQQENIKIESERERMRANLLRAVSHDLRTPLTTIYGSSATLLESGDSLSPGQRKQIITGIMEDAQWLVRMVENLLSITRLDGKNVNIIKTPTVLEELIDTVLLKFKKRYPNRTIRIEIPEELVLVPMDAMLIEQVLINILENAIQHAKGMQQLSLRVFTIGKMAVFEIMDDGCGISQERLDKLFTGSYEAANLPADSQKKNTGIGLSVCATIIKAHGGEISAENRSSGGAVFRFTLDTEDINSDTE